MGMGVQCHAPAAVNEEKFRYPLYKRLVGSQGLSGWLGKYSPRQRSNFGLSNAYEIAIQIELSLSYLEIRNKHKNSYF
jgi:hypothetical protein